VGQQAIAEQQGVGGVVDRGEGQPDAAFGHDAGGELVAGQPEGDQLPVAGQIREVFDVHLEQAEGRPAEFLSGQASGWGRGFLRRWLRPDCLRMRAMPPVEQGRSK
jgi:hypothetical protein